MNKRAKRFEYKERNFDDLKERTKSNFKERDSFIKSDFKLYKTKDGANKLRVLPPTWEGAKHYGLDIWLHYSIGGNGDGFGSTYLCNYKMLGKECCIDIETKEAEARGEKAYADSLKASRKVLMWVIDRTDEEEGPQLFAMPPNIDRELVSQSCDEETGSVRFIDHPEKGFDFSFTKTGKGKNNTKYSEYKVAWSSTPLSKNPDKVDEWIDYITDNPIPSVLNYYDDAYIKKVFSGHVFKAAEDEEVLEEKPEEEEYTYEELTNMSKNELVNLAVEVGLEKSKAKALGGDALIEFICEELKIEVPDIGEDVPMGDEKEEEDKPEPAAAVRSFREKLNSMKNKG
jgi:hypothetical protein